MQSIASKTQFLAIERDHSPLVFNEKEIHPSEFVKDLRIYLSCNPTCSQPVTEKLKTCYKTFHQLKPDFPGQLNISTKSKVLKTIIFTVLLYTSETWFPSKSVLDKLERFQKPVSRWVVSASGYQNRLLINEVLRIKHAIGRKVILMFNNLFFVGFNFPVIYYITMKLPAPYCLRRNDLITFDIPLTKKKKSEQNFFFRASKYANFSMKRRRWT